MFSYAPHDDVCPELGRPQDDFAPPSTDVAKQDRRRVLGRRGVRTVDVKDRTEEFGREAVDGLEARGMDVRSGVVQFPAHVEASSCGDGPRGYAGIGRRRDDGLPDLSEC